MQVLDRLMDLFNCYDVIVSAPAACLTSCLEHDWNAQTSIPSQPETYSYLLDLKSCLYNNLKSVAPA